MPRKKKEDVLEPEALESSVIKAKTRTKVIAESSIVADSVEKTVDIVDKIYSSKTKTRKTADIVEKAVDVLGTNTSSEQNTPRLTILTDKVDVRYGMLLKYFPKDGELRIPSGTCDTGYYVAANKHITKIYFPKTMETIGHGSFFHCEDLTSLELGENITSISAMAFSECKGLCDVVLNSGLKEIGRKAFAGCKSLNAIVIPKSVTYIGPEAFKDCENLVAVRMPSKTQLHETAFVNCHLDLKFEYY